MRSMMAARSMPDSSRAVCPLLGRMTRWAVGTARTSRPDSSRDGSSRSAALATISVGALQRQRTADLNRQTHDSDSTSLGCSRPAALATVSVGALQRQPITEHL